MKFKPLPIKWAIARTRWATLRTIAGLLLAACQPTSPTADGDRFTVGMILVWSYNDAGWNQSNYEGMQTVAEKIPKSNFNM